MEKIKKQIFLRFLKEEKCLNTFLFNFKERTDDYDTIYHRLGHFDLENFIKRMDLKLLITRAYVWVRTPQGHNYWKEKHDKLARLVEKLKEMRLYCEN